jgi:hypothetical protein
MSRGELDQLDGVLVHPLTLEVRGNQNWPPRMDVTTIVGHPEI